MLNALFTLSAAAAERTPHAERTVLAFFGTYTGPRSKGIYRAWFDPATGVFSRPEVAAEAVNPTFLAVHPNQRWLYAVNEISAFGGKRAGALSAFRIDRASGSLSVINRQPSGGTGPCHLSVDKSGQCVLVANYGSGSVAAFRVGKDGELSETGTVIQHHGASVDPQRQSGPHAHHIVSDPWNKFVLACDLGLDQVFVYRLDAASAVLSANEPALVRVKAGAGPRHLSFHPSGRFLYVLNELDSSLTTFAFQRKAGLLSEVGTVSTLPETFAGKNACAEVTVHPSGRFVYASNRGDDSIVIFAVDSKSGAVKCVGRQKTQGKTPRHFALDSSGQWLIAENQDSDTAVVFQINKKTGLLTPAGHSVEVGAPVCLVFVKTR